MRLCYISVLSALVTAPLGSVAKPPSSPWDDMHIQHSWDNIPSDWEDHGHPPSGTTINLYVALQPQHEDAMVDALYEVSDPDHPRHVH